MQLMIDLTARNDAATLRRVAALLIEVANASSVPEGTDAEHVAGIDGGAPVVVIPPPPTVAATAPAANSASTITPVIPPPPPTIPAAPAADTTATTAANTDTSASSAPPADVQLDKVGFPWDARIHSETPTINKSDGLWRMKRGIGDKRDVVEAVEAELRANYPAPVAAPPVIPPPPVSLPTALTVPNTSGNPPVIPPPPTVVAAPDAPAVTVMVPPPPPVAGSVPAGTGPGAADAFRALMNKVAGHTGPDGKLRREIMVPIYESLGCKSLTDFHKAREKIPELLAAIETLLA